MFVKKGEEKFFAIKPETSDLYFCSYYNGNNKTGHLLKLMIVCPWITTESCFDGIVTLERWLEVKGNIEEWLNQKVKEFEFLINYNTPNNGHYGTDS